MTSPARPKPAASGSLNRPVRTSKGPWLVAGTSRSGKTTLLRALNACDGNVAGLPVEGLLAVYFYRKLLFFQYQGRELLREYLQRLRRIDPETGEMARPIDFFVTPIDAVLDAAENANAPLAAIDTALCVFANDSKREFWAACDVNAEMLYLDLRRQIKGLRLLYVVRDPRESIAANLYWLSYPNRIDQSGRMLRLELLRWMISVRTGLDLARRWPNQVLIFRFDELVGEEPVTRARIIAALEAPDFTYSAALSEPPMFSYSPGRGWLTPDGNRRDLLAPRELAIIERASGDLMKEIGLSFSVSEGTTRLPLGDKAFVSAVRLSVKVSRTWPEGTKVVVDLLLSPKAVLIRRLRIAKQFVEDNLRGLGLALGASSASRRQP